MGHGAADEFLEHVLERHRHPEFIDHAGEDAVGDELAVTSTPSQSKMTRENMAVG
jgi:hypothetical protein